MSEDKKDQENQEEEVAEQSKPEKKPKSAAAQKQTSIVTMVVLFLILGSFIGFLGYFGYKTIARKLMGVDERIKVVTKVALKNDQLYEKLSEYEGITYTQKFTEYMNFLMDNIVQTRLDVKKIYSAREDHKFKIKSVLLLGGRSKKDYNDNIRKKMYLAGDYRKYRDEAERFLENKKAYTTPPHPRVGRPFRKSSSKTVTDEELDKTAKNFEAYQVRVEKIEKVIKEQIGKYKTLKKEYKKFRKMKKRGKRMTEKTVMLPIQGLSSDEIKKRYKEMSERLKVKIKELKKKRARTKRKLAKTKSALSKARDAKQKEVAGVSE